MKRTQDFRLSVLAALAAGAAALGAWWLLTRSGIPTPRHAIAAIAAGLAAAVAGGLAVQAATLRRVARWRREVDALSERLIDLGQDGGGSAAEDPRDALGNLVSFQDAGDDDPLDEALTGLVAALQDEERLRERRESVGEGVRNALRQAQELAGRSSTEERELGRLPALLTDLERSIEGIMTLAEAVHQQGVACDEIAGLMGENVEQERDACSRAVTNAQDADQYLGRSLKVARLLETRSREIGQVLTVINDITEQTNLLALNAAIIAAQAGEEGKGFGVVADEMRNLSERASSSTKETEILAGSLQEEVGRAVTDLRAAQEVASRLRENLVKAMEAAAMLTDLGKKNSTAAVRAAARADEQVGRVRDLSATLRQLAEERRRLLRLEAETLTPLRNALREICEHLETQWQMGAVRETLRKRLDGAVQTIRQARARERRRRRQLDERIRVLRDSGRTWSAALADGRRRERLLQEISREARRIASTSLDG